MTNKLKERPNDAAELTIKLQLAETEIGSLKSELQTMRVKLEDANNEIGRMSMVLKHRAQDMQSEKRLGKQNEWLHSVARQH